MKIITNNVPRLIIDWYELTEAEQAEYDHYDEEYLKNNSPEFFRYKGELYALDEFSSMANIPPKGWDGIKHDTMFSAILVRYTHDNDYIVVGRYYSG